MQTKIYIVELSDGSGNPISPTTRKIILSNELIHKLSSGFRTVSHPGHFYANIKVRHYGDNGDDYYDEYQEVKVLDTFVIMTKGEFIRDDNDKSTLNACTMSGGFGQINRLAYSFSINVIKWNTKAKIWESDLYFTKSGISATRFDMYSYHISGDKKEYTEDRLDWEVFENLNLNKIFSEYLTISDKRDNKLEELGL
jgi:hypothetical protein